MHWAFLSHRACMLVREATPTEHFTKECEAFTEKAVFVG